MITQAHLLLRQPKKGGPRTYVSDSCRTLYKSPQKPRRPHATQKKWTGWKQQLDLEKSISKSKKSQLEYQLPGISSVELTQLRYFIIYFQFFKTQKGKERIKVQVIRRGSHWKQDMKKGNTSENAQFFADCRFARFARGVEQRYKNKKTQTYVLRHY